ncbi:MAG: hypothetical protein AB8B59_05845 [Maribacter sp.]
MRNFGNYGVQELSITEAREIGGGWLTELIAVVTAVVALVKAIKGDDDKDEPAKKGGSGGGSTSMAFENQFNLK